MEVNNELDPDRHPLLMEPVENPNDREHIIDIAVRSHDDQPSGSNPPQLEIPSVSTIAPAYQTPLSSSNRVNSRNSSSTTRGDGRHGRSTLNSRLWISVELFVTIAQIVTSIVVLLLSRHERPRAPLFEWVLGYTAGCVATLPILYWRYRNRIRATEQDSFRSWQGSSQNNSSFEPAYIASSIAQASEEGNHHTGSSASRISWIFPPFTPRLNSVVDHFKMALDCFFAVWFLVGIVWIFGPHSSPSDAPKLYRLCLVFLTFSCIGYALPFILCATLCCCWPCIISALGFQEDLSQTRGATPESIKALPIYKFKLIKNGDNQETNSGISDGGLFAAGTEKERVVSGEDAVCCICLARYAENDEVRELPCSHFFHVECVDKWLKINASCPLCKYEVGESNGNASPSATNSSPRQNERRAGNGSVEGVYGTTMI